MQRMSSVLFFCLLVAIGCKPAVGRAPSLIVGPEILAVRGEPAEVSPGADVSYQFLMASTVGTVTDAQGTWDVCPSPAGCLQSVWPQCARRKGRPAALPATRSRHHWRLLRSGAFARR